MRRLKYVILFIALLTIITGCTKNDSYLKNINIKELNEKLSNGEEFFFVVTQDGCSHCEAYVPVLEGVLNENKVIAYNFNLSKLSDSERTDFYSKFDFSGTPTTIFIKDGKELSIMQRIVGELSSDKIVQKLKNTGYIK